MRLKLLGKRRLLALLIIQLSSGYGTPAKAEPAVSKMIQIEVEIVEVSLDKLLELGISWPSIITGYEVTPTVGTDLESGVVVPPLWEDITTRKVLDPTTIYKWKSLGNIRRLQSLRADLKLLDEKGAARTLAKPKLITKSGTLATFGSGGEVVYSEVTIDPSGSTIISATFKPYGIRLEIIPTIKGKDRIDAELGATVLDLDYSRTIEIKMGGAESLIPSILSRTVTAHINVKDGETVVIAGLKQTKKGRKWIGIPGLCRIPGLGLLFGRQTWVNDEATIFIFVTPTIVRKVAAP